MLNLDTNLNLRRAWDYSDPRRESEPLPLVYGDMTADGCGTWTTVCVDTTAYVYALAGHSLLAVENGNSVKLYDADGGLINASDYTLNLAHNFQGQGVIATATFSDDAGDKEPIAVSAMGKPGADGALIDNPVEMARDLVLGSGGAEELDLDLTSLTTARARADQLGFRAAGVITAARSTARVLTELLGNFLGSWWLGGRGRLRISMDAGTQSASEAELAAAFGEADLKDITVSARLDNLVNRVETLFAYNHVSDEYQAGDDGAAERDLAGIGLYGEMTRTVELAWVRGADTARAVARRLVSMLGRPRRVIGFTDASLGAVHLERGDAALLSLSWLADDQGLPLVNQIVRVLSVEPRLDQGAIEFTCMDTGCFLTKARAADGQCPADGSERAGGRRDRTSR